MSWQTLHESMEVEIRKKDTRKLLFAGILEKIAN
jgi:hypothetical protein